MKRLPYRDSGHGRAPRPKSLWPFSPRSGSLALIAATAIGIYLCFRLIQPFLSAIVWALALATLFLPLQRRLEAAFSRRGLAALCSVLAAGLLVVVPAVLIGQRLASEAVQGVEQISLKFNSESWQKGLGSYPRLASAARFIEKEINLPSALQAGAAWITNLTGSALRSSVVELLQMALTFYLLFYMLRDQELALRVVKSLCPLTSTETDQLCVDIANTIHATIYGTAAVAVAQGVLGGLMFWWLGLTAPVFWGFIMALLAFFPVLGAFIVWIPVACFLALSGDWEKALILALWGAIVVGLVDNWLYPILVGQKLKLHTVLAFISTVGGLIVFGPSGLILGPIVLTVTIFLLRIWQNRLLLVAEK